MASLVHFSGCPIWLLRPITHGKKDETEAQNMMREPFTLRLRVDDTSFYEEEFDSIPYVDDNTVYLFEGERFGVSFTADLGSPAQVRYEPELDKADLVFEFKQNEATEGKFMMLLTIENRTRQTVAMDALMTVPGETKVFPTSVVPVGPGLKNFESWPHPIVQLALRNLRVQ
jgi:hypothetical protein